MKRLALTVSVLLLAGLGAPRPVVAHCEVPCGIYGDQMRFEGMLEDHTTIAKAMAQIGELAGKADAQSLNQLVRWVNTKESHATRTQETIAQYFMSQRIQPDQEEYLSRLTSAHAVMRAAMKCKQSTDAKDAAALREAILAFHAVYEGKKKEAGGAAGGHDHDK